LSQRRSPSALAIAYTAAIAAGEAFKYAIAIDASRCVRHSELAFCPVTLSGDLAAAPMPGVGTMLYLGLVGNGAIGTAYARILGGLKFSGSHALLADPETYARENVGTYSLGNIADAEAKHPKVRLAATAMQGWNIEKVQGPVSQVVAKIDGERLLWPPVVLTGLDSIQARYDAQALWPDRLIDAATGDTVVGLHDVVPGGPCLRCFMPIPTSPGSAAQRLAEELGLPVDLLMNGDVDLTEQDVANLAVEQREILKPFVGTPICGLASALGLTGDSEDTYRPSVPFVSQQAACLGVGRLLASLAGVSDLPNFIQYNTLIGPQSMTRLDRHPTPGCYCQQRAATITIVRATRRTRTRVG
jgi:molybdopterin/thiamine biosynthesis adenylyltransferase